MSRRGKGFRAAVTLASAVLVLGASPVARADSGPLLDPANDDAMLNLLIQNGVEYDTALGPDEAVGYADPDSTLVIDEDEVSLTADQITELATAQWGRVIILTSDEAVLAAFAPGVDVAGTTENAEGPSAAVDPACGQADATSAGAIRAPGSAGYFSIIGPGGAKASASATPSATPSAAASSTASSVVSEVTGCYSVKTDGGHEAMMVTLRNSRTGGDVVVLGTSAFTENQYLTEDGDAALALRLFGAHGDLVWLATSFTEDPNLSDCGGAACDGGQPGGQGGAGGSVGGNGRSNGGGSLPTATPSPGTVQAEQVNSLLPHWIWWAVLQLAVAAAALAYWRARRMGRLVGEALPVRVHAAETVQGHANLYRRAAAHGRAAALLRAAAARRIAPLLGLPAGPAGRAPQTLVVPLAARLGRSPEEVHAVLAGVVPQTEAELVRLTDQLDRLEQEVRSR